jgi:hypothetical protein
MAQAVCRVPLICLNHSDVHIQIPLRVGYSGPPTAEQCERGEEVWNLT